MKYTLDAADVVDFGVYRCRDVRMALPMADDFIQKQSREAKQLWQQDIMEWALRYMPLNPYVVDVGSYVGSSPVWLSCVAGASGVVAIEPDPLSYSILEANVELNCLGSRVRTINAAVSDADGKAYMHADLVGNHGAAQYRPYLLDDQWSVPMVKLDTVLADRKRKVDLMWVEMEGHENKAIQGARDMIAKDKPVIAVTTFDTAERSIDPTYDCMQGYFTLLGNLSELGYVAKARKFKTTVFTPVE